MERRASTSEAATDSGENEVAAAAVRAALIRRLILLPKMTGASAFQPEDYVPQEHIKFEPRTALGRAAARRRRRLWVVLRVVVVLGASAARRERERLLLLIV